MYDSKKYYGEMAIQFALDVSNVCEGISGCRAYVDQLIRSSSSIGANLFEARYAQSNADFVHKLEISLKECYESEFWLELLFRKGKINKECFATLNETRGKLQRKLISSISTVKKKSD